MDYEYSADRLINIAISLNAEKDIDILLEKILKEAMDITNCDGGTVYVKGKESLRFNNMVTRSKGIDLRGQARIGIPDVPLTKNHICALSAIEKRRINIKDVYENDEFDFSGTKNYDRLNGYTTMSMLVIPMLDEKGDVIGVLQLINAADNAGNPTPFKKEFEDIIAALASLAAVSLNNTMLAKDVYDILHSFVRVMVGAVDIESKFNSNHTRSMIYYAERFLRWMDENDSEYKISDKEKDPFLMSIWLHDIGKLLVPLDIMNKATRLGKKIEDIHHRGSVAKLMEKVRGLEDPSYKEESDKKIKEIDKALKLVDDADGVGTISDETDEALRKAAALICLTDKGEEIPFLKDDELEAITVKKGTLTDKERSVMESHVSYTKRLLNEMSFKGAYENVPIWAADHHEYLDKTGYPMGKGADEISDKARIITIIDIYDALTAEDRPYKAPLVPEKAFDILISMAEEGKLDKDILDQFVESNAWKR